VGDALGAEFVGVGVVGADPASEFGAGEQGVVGVGCVVPMEVGVTGVVVSLGSVELFIGVGMGSEDRTEGFQGALGPEL
jgi:hypothetical protein